MKTKSSYAKEEHAHLHAAPAQVADDKNLNRLARSATLHCLTGCGIGEVLGMAIGSWLVLGTLASVALAVGLAFIFGYAFTVVPLLRSGMPLLNALGLGLAADTLSITIMEIVDNAVVLLIPGAVNAGPGTILFWASMVFSLVVAGFVAFPVNRWLIARGRGHALVSAHHAHGRSG